MNYREFGILECRCSPLLLKIKPKEKFRMRDSATNQEIKLKLKESARYHEKNLVRLNKEYEKSVVLRQIAESSVLKTMKNVGALKGFENERENSPCENRIKIRPANRVLHLSLQLKDFRQKEREKIEAKRRKIKARIILDKIRMHNAARRIQKAWRKYLVRIMEFKKLRKKVENAAVVVQSHFRGFLSRKSSKKIKGVGKWQKNEKDEIIEDKICLEEKSALRIQRFWKSKRNRLRNHTSSVKNRNTNGGLVIASIEINKFEEAELECEKIKVSEQNVQPNFISSQVKKKEVKTKPLKTKSKLGICKCKCIRDLYRDSEVKLSHHRKVNKHKKTKSRFPEIQRTNPGLKTSLLIASLDFNNPEW